MPRKIPHVELVKNGIQIYHHAMKDAFETKEDKDGITFTPEQFEAEHNKWEKFVLEKCDEQMAKKSNQDKVAWRLFREVLEGGIQELHPLFRELNSVKQKLMQARKEPTQTQEREAEIKREVEMVSQKVDAMKDMTLYNFMRNPPPLPPSASSCEIL